MMERKTLLAFLTVFELSAFLIILTAWALSFLEPKLHPSHPLSLVFMFVFPTT